MKKNILTACLALLTLTIPMSSCFQDLDLEPPFGLNSAVVYGDPDNYINVLAKLYAGLATTGNDGPAGQGDIAGIDEGFSSYLRVLWNLQVVTTDEAVLGWGDPGVPELNYVSAIDATNPWSNAMYYRIFFQLSLCNEFIREASPEKMEERGFNSEDQAMITDMVQEARFLRALSYYHALDLFGSVPFIDETDLPGSFFPEQASRQELFDYVESECLAIASLLPEPGASDYGRADRAAVWMLLAKMYLNAEVYTGQDRYADVINYTGQVINAGYSLDERYEYLFLADNHLSGEVIFPITFDGLFTKTWGGTSYLVHAAIGGTMDPTEFGVNGGWQGLRSTPSLVAQFGADTTADARAMFFTDGQINDATVLPEFTNGYAVSKWKNVDRNGTAGSDPVGNHVDTDYPLFRLADAYLMYAEANLRGGGGDAGMALNNFNALRERAYGDASGNVAALDLELILSERSRELHWEATRRTDLIRYGLFTGGSYVWAHKGNDAVGVALDEKFNLFPLPAADIAANPNLTQNPGF
jgi:hypothetical protein